jgi:hypothetical protein
MMDIRRAAPTLAAAALLILIAGCDPTSDPQPTTHDDSKPATSDQTQEDGDSIVEGFDIPGINWPDGDSPPPDDEPDAPAQEPPAPTAPEPPAVPTPTHDDPAPPQDNTPTPTDDDE